jgi:hypothetical protein
MDATFSFETSVDFQRTTRRNIPEDRTLQNHRCENLNSYIILYFVQDNYEVNVNTCLPRSGKMLATILKICLKTLHMLFHMRLTLTVLPWKGTRLLLGR